MSAPNRSVDGDSLPLLGNPNVSSFSEGAPATPEEPGIPAAELHAFAESPPAPPPECWRLPPRYQPRGAIARGGMGLVLRVHDIEVDRPLAVKLLLDHDGSATRARRFLDEARITGQLQHPSIPPVHEIGQLSDGRPFFSMKLVAGQTLAELLKERSAPSSDLPRFLHIFEQMAQTVGYAHSQGVIHRDLKPLNIMVGSFGEVQVMDWGLAKRLGQERSRSAASADSAAAADPLAVNETVDYRSEADDDRTQAGQVMGTFAYMPPEQARGEVDRVDERCDVFGLGAILCQILTGEPPYRGADNRGRWRQAREGDLADAHSRLDSCGADGELIALARSYLTADLEQRPRHAGTVAEQITAHLQSVQQRLQRAERERAIAQARTIEERKRRRWQLALAASLLLLILGGSAAGIWYSQERAKRLTEETRQQAELATRQARLEQDVAAALDETQRLHDELYAQLADARAVSALLSDMDRWRTSVQAERAAWQRAERLAAVDPSLLAASAVDRLRTVGAQIEQDELDWNLAKKADGNRLGEIVVANDYLREDAAASQLASFFRDELKLDVEKDDAETVARRLRQSRLPRVVLALLDHWAKIAKGGEQVRKLSVAARLADPDPWRDRVRDPQTWEDRGKLEQLAREADLSRQSPQVVLLLAKRLRDRGGNDNALLQAALAEYPRDFWLYETLARSTKNLTEKIGYLQSALAVRPQSFVIHERLAVVLGNERRDRDGAIRHHQIALKINPKFARAHYNLGSLLRQKGDLDGVIRHCQTAMEINPHFTSYAHTIIGEALAQKHDSEGAIQHYRLAEQTAGGDVYALDLLFFAWFEMGKNDEAMTVCRKILKIRPNDAAGYYSLGLVLERQHKLDESIAAYRKAIDLDPNLSAAHYNLSHNLYDIGERDAAVAACRKAIQINPNHALYNAYLGFLLFNQMKWDEAAAAYRKTIEIEADHVIAHKNLAMLLKKQKKFKEASAAYAKLITIGPKEAAHRCRFAAAYNAVLAGCGKGVDAAKLDQAERGRLREQALNWFQNELRRQVALDDSRKRFLSSWLQDKELAPVREPKELAKLPEMERQTWQRLWTEVKELIEPAQAHGKDKSP